MELGKIRARLVKIPVNFPKGKGNYSILTKASEIVFYTICYLLIPRVTKLITPTISTIAGFRAKRFHFVISHMKLTLKFLAKIKK